MLSVGRSVRRSVGRSVGRSVLNFVIFQKVRFREEYSNLSNTTKLTLLDSLLQEFTAGAMYVFISLKLWVLEIFSEDSELIFTFKVDFDLLLGQ